MVTERAGVAEQADARDLKSRGSISRTGSSPVSGTNPFKYRAVEQLVARRAHNPEVMRFKSHPRNQEAVPKKMHRGKPEIFSGFLRFSPFFSLFQKSKNNADKKMQNTF